MHRLLITAFALLAVAGCGGGGGDDAGPPVAATPLALTSANYVQASQEALSNAVYLSNIGSLVSGANVANDGVILQIAVNQALDARGWFRSAPKLVTGVTTTDTLPCDGGGSITATIDDLNGNDDADTGDSARVTITNCIELGYTTNGAMTINFTSVTGSIGVGSYSASIAVTVDSLDASSAAGRSTGSGRINLALTGSGSTSTLTLTVPSFTLNSTYGSTVSNGSLSNFSITVRTEPVGFGSSSSTTLSGVVASTGLNNHSISIATVSPIVASSSEPYPASGQLIITGAANSKLRMTALNSTSVRLELDADGDGNYETSTTHAWSQFI